MIFSTRLIVQRDTVNKDKYYPKVVSVRTNETYPWSCKTAEIEIITNTSSGTSNYISPIRKGDIVRLQVSVRYSATEKTVWEDIFEGRIEGISSSFGTGGNNTTLSCKGHDEECLYKGITADYSASAAKTGAMLSALQTAYLTRITDASPSLIDSTDSSAITSYNIQKDTRYFADAIRDFEAFEGYAYQYSVVPTYDSDGDLSAVYGSWQPVPTTASSKVKVIEGKTLLSARFESTLAGLVNDVTQYGLSGTPQKTGNATDAASIASYNTRHHFTTDLTLATDALCLSLATAIKTQSVEASNNSRGTVTILGNPNVAPGMLVYHRIPSVVIEGSSIDGNYRIRRVSHTIDNSGWTIDLDVGELILTDGEIMADFHTKNRLNNSNLVD
jgi:hypothetical protein